MEYPPASHFIVIIVFLGTFTLLVMTMPSGLFAMQEEYTLYDVPDTFKAIDLHKYGDVDYYTFPGTGTTHHEEIGGHDIRISHSTIFDYIRIRHVYMMWGIFYYGEHSMTWWTDDSPSISRETTLSYEEMDADYDASLNMSAYIVKCKHFPLDTYLAWDNTTFNTPSEALVGGDLDIFWGINLDDMGTGLNAWDMASQILFWQMPQVNTSLNILISLPLWACISWLIFAFIYAIIKSLPFT